VKILIAPDSFKESMTAVAAAEAMARGVRKAAPEAQIGMVPMADGGQGTVATMVAATGGRIISAEVTDPLGKKIKAQFGILGDGRTAVIEMAAASGLMLVPPERRNPLVTTTFGTGETIKAALGSGVKKIIIGIGGSATNDGGAGMAQALGAHLLNATGRDLPFGGAALAGLERIDASGLDPRLKNVELDVACDVTNPLLGEKGASAVFGPQKGATPETVKQLDAALAHYADILQRDLGKDVRNEPGAGAAGGLGAGLMAFLGARLRRGIEIVIDAVNLRERMKGCDLVLTGEGAMDRQTVFGKTAIGVAKVAQSLGIPIIAIVGGIGDGAEEVMSHGILAYFSIVNRPMPLQEAMTNAAALTESCAEQVMRVWMRGRQ
jgi:glycerate kinase